MKHYNAAVEVSRKGSDVTDDQVDELMEALAVYHGSVGTSPRGWLEARVTLPAESLAQATMTAVAVVESVAGAAAIAAVVMTEEEQAAREGFTVEPEIMTMVEAAEMLGLSRQRVQQLARDGRLQAVPWSGRSTALTRSSVEAFAAQPRLRGRPRKEA